MSALSQNLNRYQDYVDAVKKKSTLSGALAGEDLAHVRGSGSGGESLTDARKAARSRAYSLGQKQGLFNPETGQYLDIGFNYVTEDGVNVQTTGNPGEYAARVESDAFSSQTALPVIAATIAAASGLGPLATGLLSGGASAATGNDLEDAAVTGIAAGVGSSALGGASAGNPWAGAINPTAGNVLGTSAIGAAEGGLGAAIGAGTSTASTAYHNFADSSGNPAPNSVQTEPVPGEGILDWVGEQIMNTPDNAINIPIPGLPFPIPGNMSITDLWDIAKRTGKSIQEVIAGIGQDPEEGQKEGPSWNMPLPEDDEDDVRVGVGGPIQRDPVDEEDEPQLVLGPGGPPVESPRRPGVTPGEQPNSRPGVTPQTPPGEQPNNPGGVPGENGDNNRPGFEAALIGLLPLLSPDPPQREPGEYDLWDYIGADDSYGIQRPNYGTPQMKPLYNFPTQPNQPMQVNNNPQARRDFINPVEAERRRRGLL